MDENGLKVNTGKTKVMVVRNGGKRKQNEKWYFKGVELETVNEFKYLSYWLTTKNSLEKQIKTMAGKAQKAANATWGLMKRSVKDKMTDRMHLMNSMVGAVVLYGVETWGWGNLKNINKIQGRFCKKWHWELLETHQCIYEDQNWG